MLKYSTCSPCSQVGGAGSHSCSVALSFSFLPCCLGMEQGQFLHLCMLRGTVGEGSTASPGWRLSRECGGWELLTDCRCSSAALSGCVLLREV